MRVVLLQQDGKDTNCVALVVQHGPRHGFRSGCPWLLIVSQAVNKQVLITRLPCNSVCLGPL